MDRVPEGFEASKAHLAIFPQKAEKNLQKKFACRP
jgi:hypothetical protein